MKGLILILFIHHWIMVIMAAPKSCKDAIQEKYTNAVCTSTDSPSSCEKFCDDLSQKQCYGLKAFVDIMHCNNTLEEPTSLLYLTCCCE